MRAAGGQVHLPLQRGWFDGEEVIYVTTDASDAEMAKAKAANYAPRLANAALPSAASVAGRPGERSATDRVYDVVNHTQAVVFASAPDPMGPRNAFLAYSPLWQLVKVTWKPGQTPRTLTSEDAVLDAVDKGQLTLAVTKVVLNCPIVYRGAKGALPGVGVDTR